MIVIKNGMPEIIDLEEVCQSLDPNQPQSDPDLVNAKVSQAIKQLLQDLSGEGYEFYSLEKIGQLYDQTPELNPFDKITINELYIYISSPYFDQIQDFRVKYFIGNELNKRLDSRAKIIKKKNQDIKMFSLLKDIKDSPNFPYTKPDIAPILPESEEFFKEEDFNKIKEQKIKTINSEVKSNERDSSNPDQ